MLLPRAVSPRRRSSCREHRGDDSRHQRLRKAAACRALDSAQRDPIRPRRRHERVGNGNRRSAPRPPRRGQSFVRRHRRDGPRGLRRLLVRLATRLWSRGRGPRLSNDMHRRLHPGYARLSPRPRRCASPWPHRRRSRFRDRPGLGRRRDHDRSRRGRRRRRRPWHRLRRRRLARRRWLYKRRQEEERVDVPLRLGGSADAQMHVRDGLLGHAARSDGGDRVPFAHRRPAPDRHGAEMEQRDGVAVRRLDRERPSASRHDPGERDDAARRRAHRGAGRRADVDPAVETTRVRIGAEAERVQNRPLHRPGPPVRRCGRDERGRRDAARESREQRADLLPVLQTAVYGSRRPQPLSNLITERSGRAGFARPPSASRRPPPPADVAPLRRRAPRPPPRPRLRPETRPLRRARA